MNMNKHPIVIATLLLAFFALIGSSLVAFTHQQTKAKIEFNERQALRDSLLALVPAERIDNAIAEDRITVRDPKLLGTEKVTIYRGRKQGQPVAAVLTPVVPDGYSGPIKLLVAVNRDGTLSGVRVISHKETPGLGDQIETEKSDWVDSFTGKSLKNPGIERWKVKKDGGVFDQFTGATITPRSIVKMVKQTLEFVHQKGDAIYRQEEQVKGKKNG